MKAKWLHNGSLDASGRPLGAESAPGASPETSWRGSGAARGPQKNRCSGPGGLLGRKVDRFGLREVILEVFFAAGPCGTRKVKTCSIV